VATDRRRTRKRTSRLLSTSRRTAADKPAGGGDSRRAGTRLPAFMKLFFWDYDFGRLRWPVDRALVLNRLLAEGDLAALRWLRRQVGLEGIRDRILARCGRGLSPRQLRYWQTIAGLPASEVDSWIAARRKSPWDRRAG